MIYLQLNQDFFCGKTEHVQIHVYGYTIYNRQETAIPFLYKKALSYPS